MTWPDTDDDWSDVKFRRTTLTLAGAFAVIGLGASPAYAWDCIRVSGSTQGLQQSSAHGQWEYLTIDDLIAGAGLTGDQASCVRQAWTDLGEPTDFAIGTGVAGARGAIQSGHISDTDFFELAKNAPFKVVVDGRGVDHLDDAIEILAGDCLQPPA